MNIKEIQQEIINEFENINNWADRYARIVELGKKLPAMDNSNKIDSNLIRDCKMKTWVCSTYREGKVFYQIDSQSLIVRGVGSLIVKTLSGQSPTDIKNADLYFIDKVCQRSTEDIKNLIAIMKQKTNNNK